MNFRNKMSLSSRVLIGMKNKESLLDQLDVGVSALGSISRNIAELAPIGFFAMGVHAAGMIAAVTPLSYRQVVGPVRNVLGLGN